MQRLLLLVAAATVALVLAPAAASAQTIVNPSWLETHTVSGQGDINASSKARMSFVVSHARGRQVTGLQIDDDWNGSNDVASKPVVAVTPQKPAGEFNYSRVSHTHSLNSNNTGISGLGITGCGTNRVQRNIHVRARLDDGTFTPSVSTDIRLLRVDYNTCDDFAYLYDQTQTVTQAAPGQTVGFTFKGDDSDAPVTGNRDWTGYRWRWRRVNDGATSGTTTVCPDTSMDNSAQTVSTSFPQRGRYVVEAVLASGNGGSCNYPNGDDWHFIGAVDVNTLSGSPTAALSIPRPTVGQTITATATLADSDPTGAPQMVEWDADGNNAFERRELGTPGITTAMRQQTIDTSGMTPGLKTVRVRATDNGAISGADSIRRDATATATFLVDTPPVAQPQQLVTWEGDAIPVTLSATDADGDSLTYSIASQPSNGSVSGTGTNRTYTPAPGFSGTDAFVFRANDGWGGIHEATVTVTVHPDTAITSGPSGFTRETSATFAFAERPGLTFDCKLDDGDFGPCTNPQVFNSLEDGEHDIEVRGRDAAGNVDKTPATRAWTVYTGPLRTVFRSGPATFTQAQTATFAFEATEPGATFTCALDEADAEPCESGKSYAGLDEGMHTLRVVATAPGGQVETPGSTYTWTVDRTPPRTSLVDVPARQTNEQTARFTFTSEPGARFECSFGDDAFTACPSGQQYHDLTDGPKRFRVRAIDQAGNVDPEPELHEWTVDTVAPGVSLDGAPSGLTRSPDAIAEFTTDDDTAVLECRVDGEPFQRCYSPHRLDDLEDGDHRFEVRAADRAGNRSEVAGSDWEIDTLAPQTTIATGPSGLTRTDAAAFWFSADDQDATFECRLDAGAWEDCTPEVELEDLAEGAHAFSVRATDAAGNVEPTPATRTWTVDTVAPGVVIDGAPAAATNDPEARVDFSSPAADVDRYECALHDDPAAEIDWEDCASPFVRAVGAGAWTFRVRAIDEAGNTGPEQTATWMLDTTAPVTTLGGLPTGTVSATTATATFSADKAVRRFECRMGAGTWRTCADASAAGQSRTSTVTGLDDGEHTFSVRAVDLAGNVGEAQQSAPWRVDTQAPQSRIDGGPSGVVRSGEARFTFSASKPGATFTCSVDGRPAAPCSSPHTVTGLRDGAHTLDVRATAGGLTEASPARRTWRVDTVAPDTRIVSGPPAETASPDAGFEIEANEDGATFECRVDAGAWKGCQSPAMVFGLPAGARTMSVRAVDEAGNVDASPATYGWTITAAAPGAPPAPPAQSSASTSCTFAAGTGCGKATTLIRLRDVKKGVRGAWLQADGGGAELGSVRFALPKGMAAHFPKAARNKVVGTLLLRRSDAKTRATHGLTLPARPGRSAVLLSRGALKVTVTTGAKPTVVVSGLPVSITAVEVRLASNRAGVLRLAKGCTAPKPTTELADRAGTKKTLKGDAACGGSAAKKKGASR
jgi:hypothetical protein